MTFPQIITTFAGAFIFPFLIRLCWGKMVDECWGPIGGWMAAGFIVGTTWTLNHGVGLIIQKGAWIDMAWAAGIGLFVASAASGDNVGKGLTNAMMAIIGGTLGGFILSNLG